MEILGCTRDIPGGGFLYTNADTVSIGVVLSLPQLAASGVRPEELVADLKAHPSIAPLLRGSTLREYAAHLIPEGGYDTMPALAADGLLVAGDAGAMTLAAGLWLEGVNFAIGSGHAAGRAADRALTAGDCSARGLASYRADLEAPVRAGRPQAAAQGAVPGPVRPRPAALPRTAVRPGGGDVHGDQPDAEGRRPEGDPGGGGPPRGEPPPAGRPTPCGA